MTIQITDQFHSRWSTFWATTYSFEQRAFDEFWLPRLGDPPLNTTLLVDFWRLAEVWANLAEGEQWRARRANRDYLVRGVPVRGGAFHPKTYFFANASEGILLVGSGNLGLHGLEEGHETFCRFDSRQDTDVAVIRGWRDWMARLVRHLNDHQLTARWLDLQGKAPWLQGVAGATAFVANWDRSLLAQIMDSIRQPVSELHVMAPFFDRGAKALQRVISAAQPRVIHLYTSRGLSVEGPALVRVLEDSTAEVHVYGFEPDRFVHAKLLGFVGDGQGWLLSGSANVTQAALLGAVEEGSGNAEAGVLLPADADIIRGVFVPAGLTVQPRQVHDLDALMYRRSAELARSPLALQSATQLPDRRIAVVYSGRSEFKDLYLSNAQERQRIQGHETLAPLSLGEAVRLVWLTDADGLAVSNRVPIDDPAQLGRWLQKGNEAADRPRELELRDLETPVGQMLERLHRECIFDIEDMPVAARLRRGAEEAEDAAFWDRLMQEELRLDPRVDRYRDSGAASVLEGDVFELLRLMLASTPEHGGLRAVNGHDTPTDENTPGVGKPWTPERRLQMRLYNVLERWCRAVGDPRQRWIDPLAPARNYAHLLGAISECWAQRYLAPHRLIVLTGILLGRFIRTEGEKGYLLAASDSERAHAMASLDPAAPALAAALVYAALRPSGPWGEHVFDWQWFLVPGLDLGVIAVGPETPGLVYTFVESTMSEQEVEERLNWAANYIDDRQWCIVMQRELGLQKVELTAEKVSSLYGVTLTATGIADPLADPRLVTLVRAALEYRRRSGAIVTLPAGRISVRLDDHVYARFGREMYESRQPVTRALIERLETNGAGWGAIVAVDSRRHTA
jgi:HKD family nuclease